MSENKSDPANPAKRTYFGLASLLTAVLSGLFLGAFLAVSQLDISADKFSFWNNLTAVIYCLVTPLASAFIILAWRSKKDSRSLAGIAAAAIGLPFLILFVQFVRAVRVTP